MVAIALGGSKLPLLKITVKMIKEIVDHTTLAPKGLSTYRFCFSNLLIFISLSKNSQSNCALNSTCHLPKHR